MGAAQPPEQLWKTKYRALLDEQAANDEYTDLLRQSVIRLSHCASGRNEALDELLQQLRHKVRRGTSSDELELLLQGVDEASSALESAPQAAAPASAPASNSQALATELKKPAAPEPAFTSISERIENVLSDMVSSLQVPESVAESKQRIEQTLQHGLNWYELIATLEELSLVVAGTLYDGERDYTGFLQQVIGSLAELRKLVTICQTAEQRHCDNTNALQKNISASIGSLDQFLAGNDLQELKKAVKNSLNVITNDIQQVSSEQENSAQEFRENVHSLTSQVLQLQQQVVDAHKQVELHKTQATTDPLTRLPNRAAYAERLELEYKRWVRYQRPLSIAVADLDYFKRINDEFGHLAGDAVLLQVADAIRNSLRQTDFAGRYGGEEFVILMPETTEQNAIIAMEKLRTQLAALPCQFERQRFDITVSFGVSAYRAGDNINMAFARADQALYAAKQQGRNRCVGAGGP